VPEVICVSGGGQDQTFKKMEDILGTFLELCETQLQKYQGFLENELLLSPYFSQNIISFVKCFSYDFQFQPGGI
jgi:hypothetical protein